MANKPSPWATGEHEPFEQLAKRILSGLGKRGEGYQAYVKYPKDKSGFVTIGSIIGGHYSWNEQGFTVWVDAWERNPEWPRTNILGIKQSRRFGPVGEPATLEGVETALRYVAEAFPDYTEEKWVNNSIPAEVAVELDILGHD